MNDKRGEERSRWLNWLFAMPLPRSASPQNAGGDSGQLTYFHQMDVDVPAPKSAIQFNSDSASKGAKRPTADLPVEAQDNLPWSVLDVHIFEYIAN